MNSHTSHLNKTKLRNELFYPELKKLNSVNKTITYTDSIYGALKLKNIDTAVYAEIINETLKKRFKHKTSFNKPLGTYKLVNFLKWPNLVTKN
jgi:hypothetical protein